jgi:serine phosphatase RsbU (regulator of sigma subunit)
LCEKFHTASPADLLEHISLDVADFSGDQPQHDDMTVAIFHCVT